MIDIRGAGNMAGVRVGTGTEGVFRLSANAAVVEELVGRFDRGEAVDFDTSLIMTTSAGKTNVVIDAHIVAALLKRWFRELPEPLCTTEMYDMWMAAASIKDAPTKLQQVKKVLSFLPLSNQILVKYLAAFLRSFAVFADDTKMTSKNLSICFAPNLLRAPETIGLADQMEESPIATGLLVMFIENFDNVFDCTVGIAPPFAESPIPNGKSSLVANLPPPPPVSAGSPKSPAGPTPPPNKPSPKFATKKTGFRISHSREISNDSSPPSPLTLSGSGLVKSPSSSLQSSPDAASLPPPIQTMPTESSNGHIVVALPPPPVAPKPTKGKLKRSANKKLGESDDSNENALSPREDDISPSQSPPPQLGDPSDPSAPYAPGAGSGSSTPLSSSGQRAPPPRPTSIPPTSFSK